MPQTRQHIQGNTEHFRQRHSSALDAGVWLTRESIERFIDACETRGRVEGTLKWYRQSLNRLYNDLPEDKTIRRGPWSAGGSSWWRRGTPPAPSTASCR